jgi:hypothetical protein
MSDATLRKVPIPWYVHPCFAALAMIGMAGLERAGVLPEVGWEIAWEGMAILYVAGYVWARRRYR